MKFSDRLKVNSTGTSAATVTCGAAATGCRTLAQAIAAGDLTVGDIGIPFIVDDGMGNWEMSLFTITSSTVLTRNSVLGSSAGGTIPATFTGATLTVFNTVPSSYVSGAPLTDYLAANDAGTPTSTDLIPLARGNSLLSSSLLNIASIINGLWPTAKEKQVLISTTASFPLDSSSHNRARVICTATPASITAPGSFASVGNGFSCKIENISGTDIPLTGITVRPSGSVIPNGCSAEIFAANSTIYATVMGIVGTATPATAPGQVTGLIAGSSSQSTQALSWTAPSTGTAPFTYKVEYSANAGTSWTVAAGSVSGTSYTVTGLTASTSYQYRVSATNTANTGTPSTVVTASTTAASAETITVNTPTAKTTNSSFSVTGTYANATPTALDYSLDSGTTWTAAATPTISAGSYSFNITITAINASQTIQVRDHSAQTVIGTSGSFAVTATAVAPFTVAARTSFQKTSPTNQSLFYWQDITATGTATIASAQAVLSETNTAPPATTGANGIVVGTAGSRTVNLGALNQYGTPLTTYIHLSGTGSVNGSMVSSVDFYYWVFITDSNGVTWKFVYPNKVTVGDSVGNTTQGVTMTAAQVS